MMLGTKLREIRESKKLNQTQLGELVGVNLNTVSAFERGDRLPDLDYLINLAELINADLTELIKLRVEASPSFNPMEKSPSRTFISHLNRDDYFQELTFRSAAAAANAKNQKEEHEFKLETNFGHTPKVVTQIDLDLMLNCYRACTQFFEQFLKLEISLQISYVIKFYNNLSKMTEALGTELSELKVLEVSGIVKQLEILLALRKLERI